MNLESTQNVVESLYETTFLSSYNKNDKCRCDKCVFCKTDRFLRERIKQNLRMILCDVIALRKR